MKKQAAHPRRNTSDGKHIRARLRALKRTIGANTCRIRKAQGIPLRTLSKRTGFSAVKLDYWEMGRMDISLLAIIRIAMALKVPVERLFVHSPRTEEATVPTSSFDGLTGESSHRFS